MQPLVLESRLVTIRPLPETDLARIAPQPLDMKRKSLEQMNGGFPPFSYRPLRACYFDILNIQPDLNFDVTELAPWNVIEADLRRRSKSDNEFKNNRRVALGLHDFTTSGRVIGRKHEFFPLAMGSGRKLTFWLPMILGIDDKASAIFIEPRSTKGLNEEGRRFVFSMMHERIRAADEDFADVQLTIVQFGSPSEDRRPVRLYTDKDVPLYTLDELELMVSETYGIWQEICAEREQASHRPSTGTDGPLFDYL